MTKGLLGYDTDRGRMEHDGAHSAYEPNHIDARRLGIKADGTTDNTAKLIEAAQHYAHAVGDIGRTVIHLAPGVTRGCLDLYPGVEFHGSAGSTLAAPQGGAQRHLIRPGNPAWQYAKDGSGAHRAALRNLTIDGRRSEHEYGAGPHAPTTVTTSPGTGGSMTAGAWMYAVAYRTEYGIGAPSDVVWATTPANGKVTLTWSGGGQWSEWADVVIYRGPGNEGRDGIKVITTLPAGTTTWTDTGAAPAGPDAGTPLSYAHLSGASIVLTGAAVVLENVHIINLHGSVLSDWRTQDGVAGEPYYSSMEAMWSRVYINGINGNVVIGGPHDMQIDNIFISGSSEVEAGTLDALTIERGNCKGYGVHVWGHHRDGFRILSGPTEWHACESEGHQRHGVHPDNDLHTWIGGRVYKPGPGATGFYPEEGASLDVQGVQFYNFGASTGAPVDLSAAPGQYHHIQGRTSQPGGTLVAGLNAARHDVQLVSSQAGGPASVINRVAAFTPPASYWA